ncbi:MAG: sigma-70 family RNA polymerase sigma factor [Planctomycetota bacterium]
MGIEEQRRQPGQVPREPNEEDDRFLELLAENQLRLRGFIFSLVRDFADADDLAQQTFLALWKKRDAFDPSREFLPWACGVARFEVLLYRRSRATDRLQFDDALLNTLAVEYLEQVDESDQRRLALHQCMAKLAEKDRRLLQVRYHAGTPVAEIASQIGRPLSTVYRSLAQVRESLYQCVQRSLAREMR